VISRFESPATIPANFPANLGTLQHLSRVRTLSFWRAPSPLRFESHQNVLSKRQAGLGLFLAGGPDLRSASSPTRTSFPTGKPDWDSFLLAGPISAPLRVPPERPFQPASRIGDYGIRTTTPWPADAMPRLLKGERSSAAFEDGFVDGSGGHTIASLGVEL
jgi:hypothetical protein